MRSGPANKINTCVQCKWGLYYVNLRIQYQTQEIKIWKSGAQYLNFYQICLGSLDSASHELRFGAALVNNGYCVKQ